jgi:hypothetical protein
LAQLVDYIFDRKGEVDTVWLIESPRGQVMTVTPLTTSEQELADFMRVFFQKHKVTRYVHAGAYHTAADDQPIAVVTSLFDGASDDLPSGPPDKVVFSADDGFEVLAAIRDIIRPDGNGKPYLSRLEIRPLDRRDSRGVFLNLLPMPAKGQKH